MAHLPELYFDFLNRRVDLYPPQKIADMLGVTLHHPECGPTTGELLAVAKALTPDNLTSLKIKGGRRRKVVDSAIHLFDRQGLIDHGGR
jgi:hypothetical protein